MGLKMGYQALFRKSYFTIILVATVSFSCRRDCSILLDQLEKQQAWQDKYAAYAGDSYGTLTCESHWSSGFLAEVFHLWINVPTSIRRSDNPLLLSQECSEVMAIIRINLPLILQLIRDQECIPASLEGVVAWGCVNRGLLTLVQEKIEQEDSATAGVLIQAAYQLAITVQEAHPQGDYMIPGRSYEADIIHYLQRCNTIRFPTPFRKVIVEFLQMRSTCRISGVAIYQALGFNIVLLEMAKREKYADARIILDFVAHMSELLKSVELLCSDGGASVTSLRLGIQAVTNMATEQSGGLFLSSAMLLGNLDGYLQLDQQKEALLANFH